MLFFPQATELVSKLYAAHQEGRKNVGFDIEGDGAVVKDVVEEAGILDLYLAKLWGIKLATSVVNTILRVDQVSMAGCVVCVCCVYVGGFLCVCSYKFSQFYAPRREKYM